MTTWTVYFGTGYDMEASRKCTGSPEEMQKLIDSWKNFGCFVHKIRENVWFVEV